MTPVRLKLKFNPEAWYPGGIKNTLYYRGYRGSSVGISLLYPSTYFLSKAGCIHSDEFEIF